MDAMLNSELSFMVDKPLAILGIVVGAMILGKVARRVVKLLVRRLGRRRASHGPGLLRRHTPPSLLDTGEMVSTRAVQRIEALAVALAGGDPGEDRLIAFYAAYRALVRAKVALLRAAQHPASSGERAHESAVAPDLLGLAERFAWQARLPLVIVLCGVPTAGKSHLARALAETSRLPHLSSDVTRKRLARIRPQQRAGDAAYSSEFNRLTYAELGRRAARETSARGGALVDATFRHRADRDTFADAFADAAPLLFVECRAPARVLAERAAQRDSRRGRVSDASLSIVLRESSTWEPLDELPPEAHLTVRSDRPVEAQLEDLCALLDRRIGLLTTREA